MHNYLKIGIGLLTCNRKDFFKQQLESILNCDYIDEVVIVKNKEFDYSDMFNDLPEHVKFFNVKEDLGIGYCKNVALKQLLEDDCLHLFLIEDDIKIKDTQVFKQYIDTAKAFNLEHLIFGAVYTPPSWQIDKIVHTAKKDNYAIDMYLNLHGGFVYFTKKCLQYCGLFDERYINAVEHIDHTYRIVNFGFYTPFWAFADIHDSSKYLEDSLPSNPSTINNNELQKQRISTGFKLFYNTWHLNIPQIPPPTIDSLNAFLQWRLHAI